MNSVLFVVPHALPSVAHATPEILLSQPLTVRWRYDSNVTLNLTPAFDNERIYLPLAGGTIVALESKRRSARSGVQRWAASYLLRLLPTSR